MLLPLFIIWNILFGISILPNLLLLTLNLQNAKQMSSRPYNIFLIDMALGDILISFGMWFSMPCSLPAGETKPTVYFGYCQYLGAAFCFHSHQISEHFVYNNICIVLASFIARRRILVQNNSLTYFEAFLIASVAYLPAFATMIIEYQIPSQIGILPSSNQLFQNISLPPDELFPFLNLQLGSWPGITAAIVSPLLVLGCCCVSLILRWRLKKILKSVLPTAMSPATKIMHVSLIKTLSLQTCVPLLTLASGILYDLFGYGTTFSSVLIYSPITNSISFFVNLLIPLLNSCTALYYIPTYRRTLKKLIRIDPSSVRTHPVLRIDTLNSIATEK